MTVPYWIPVTGGSMVPLLRDGDLVQVVPFSHDIPAPLWPGVLILFLQEGMPVVHRYAGMVDGKHLQRADRTGKTSTVELDDILGVITLRKRRNRVRRPGMPLRWKLRRGWQWLVDAPWRKR